MTPDEITTIFAAATNDFAAIVGQPTDDDINALKRALLPLLHDVDYDMYGTQNLVGIIEPSITYTLTWGQAFVRPPRPTPYNLTIADAATPVVRNRSEAKYTLLLNVPVLCEQSGLQVCNQMLPNGYKFLCVL